MKQWKKLVLLKHVTTYGSGSYLWLFEKRKKSKKLIASYKELSSAFKAMPSDKRLALKLQN